MDEKSRQQSLKASFWDGVFTSMMTGLTANYTTPFALLLGARNFQIGLLNAFPQLANAFSQLISADLVEKIRSRLRFITYSVLAQSILWFAIAIVPYVTEQNQVTLFIGLLTLNTILGAIATPPWTSLMSDTVPKDKYGAYFAWRGRVLGFISLVINLLVGFWLTNVFITNKYLAFMLLFALAGISRVVSGYFIRRMVDVPLEVVPEKKFYYLEFIKRLPESNFVKFTLYVAILNFATSLSGPFFAVYMLETLKLTYSEYAIISTAGTLGGLIGLPLWGKLADRYGNIRMLRLAALLIPILPVMWVVSKNIIYLSLINAFASYIWGGFNLCAVNFIFDAASPPVRTRCLGYFSFTNGVAVFSGAFLSGGLISYLPPIRLLSTSSIISNCLTLFLFSGLLRSLINLVGLDSFKEVRKVDKIEVPQLLVIILGLKPMISLGQEIFLPKFRRSNHT